MQKKFLLSKHFILILPSLILVGAGFVALHLSSCITVRAFSCANRESAPTVAQTSELAPHYYVYSTAALQNAYQNGKVVLYFWAPWCSTCTTLDMDLQSGKVTLPNGVTVLRINYDDASDLRRTYSVVTQHTFVQIDRQGHELTTWVGGDVSGFARYLK